MILNIIIFFMVCFLFAFKPKFFVFCFFSNKFFHFLSVVYLFILTEYDHYHSIFACLVLVCLFISFFRLVMNLRIQFFSLVLFSDSCFIIIRIIFLFLFWNDVLVSLSILSLFSAKTMKKNKKFSFVLSNKIFCTINIDNWMNE